MYPDYPLNSILVEPGFNNRKSNKPDAALLESIRRIGVKEALHVRSKPETRDAVYLVEGHRRYHALRMLGIGAAPVIHHGELSDKAAQTLSVVLNASRTKKLFTKKERCEAFAAMHENGYDVGYISQVTGYPTHTVAEHIRAFSTVPEIQEALAKDMQEGGISSRVASRAADLSPLAQRRIVPLLKGAPRQKGLEIVRQAKAAEGRASRGRKATVRLPLSAEEEAEIYRVASDYRERCQAMEAILRRRINAGAKNPIYAAQLDIIKVIRGQKKVSDVFPDTIGNYDEPRKNNYLPPHMV
jgi:ParB-like chromosome segregation protein Spo0J